MGKVAIIAHRGASAYAPEKTLAAFKLAREQGADFFELDVRLCGTGEVVVMHDATVDRTTNATGRVADLSLSRLRRLGVATLREALKLAGPGFGCYLEIKGSDSPRLEPPKQGHRNAEFNRKLIARLRNHDTTKLTRAVLAEICALRKGRHVVVQSFSAIACAVARIEAPKLRVELLTPGKRAADWRRAMELAKFFGLRGVNTSLATITRARVAALREAGLRCAVYTVNERTDMQRLAAWGVTGLITDRPDAT